VSKSNQQPGTLAILLLGGLQVILSSPGVPCSILTGMNPSKPPFPEFCRGNPVSQRHIPSKPTSRPLPDAKSSEKRIHVRSSQGQKTDQADRVGKQGVVLRHGETREQEHEACQAERDGGEHGPEDTCQVGTSVEIAGCERPGSVGAGDLVVLWDGWAGSDWLVLGGVRS
jgi:hypothetical protein